MIAALTFVIMIVLRVNNSSRLGHVDSAPGPLHLWCDGGLFDVDRGPFDVDRGPFDVDRGPFDVDHGLCLWCDGHGGRGWDLQLIQGGMFSRKCFDLYLNQG